MRTGQSQIEHFEQISQARLNAIFLSVAIIAVTLLSKFMLHMFLPDRHFFDGNLITRMMLADTMAARQSSFTITAYISDTINIFGFTELLHWSIFYSIVFTPIVIRYVLQFRVKGFFDYVFIVASVGLLNIFVFVLSKDVFQFTLFLLIGTIIKAPISISTWKRAALSIGLLYFWGWAFRLYFFIVAIYSLMTYLTLLLIRKKNKSGMILLPVILTIGVFVSLVGLMIFMPEEYEYIIMVRYIVNYWRVGAYDAATMISDIIYNPGGNVFLYMINYIFNVLRLMLPFELFLVLRNPQQILFLFYQIALTVLYLKTLKKFFKKQASEIQLLSLSIFTGFLLVSGFYQPDFGSWTRHNISLWPVMISLIFDYKGVAHERFKKVAVGFIGNSKRVYTNLPRT